MTGGVYPRGEVESYRRWSGRNDAIEGLQIHSDGKKTGMKQKIETISAVSLFGAILVASIGDES
jgi:hypothetical protein